MGPIGVSISPIMDDTKESNSDNEFLEIRFYLLLDLLRC